MSGVTLSGGAGGALNTGAVELTDSGGRALKLQTDAPHLVSMGGGRLSTAVTLHPIPQGRVTLGSSPAADIPVQGTGVLPLHCHIENSEGVVTIYPLSEYLSIDGVPVTGPTRLSQGVMLTIGRSNYMRFNHPAEAKLMKAVLPNSRISMAPISFEIDNNFHTSKFVKKPPVVPRKSPRESFSDEEPPPSSIMMKVSKFEYLAAQNFKKSISPKVFSANLVTMNTPAKDVLGKAPPDLNTFAKNLPQSALNYSELNQAEKQKIKTPDRQIFGRKSPNYVNVTLNETKTINNRVIIYENGCVPKNQQHSNDLNNVNNKIQVGSVQQHISKTVNVSRTTTPSPNFNRNPPPYNRSVTSSPVSNNAQINQSFGENECDVSKSGPVGVSGSLEDVAQRKNEAELRRNQAQIDRIKEQELEKAEQARLEEILNMCAEYEKQVQCEKTNKPITPNRIKTNGSLPRDKRQCISPTLITSSPSPHHPKDNHVFHFDTEYIAKQNNNAAYENVTLNHVNYENIEFKVQDGLVVSSDLRPMCGSPYENISAPHFQQSPRTRIKTFVGNKDSSTKDATDIIESKFAIVSAEQHLIMNKKQELQNKDSDSLRKPTPTKFILPLDINDDFTRNSANYDNVVMNNYAKIPNFFNGGVDDKVHDLKIAARNKHEADKIRIEKLRTEKKDYLSAIAKIKRQMAETEIQGEELHRELEMERALISGEFKCKETEVEKYQTRKEKLLKRAMKIDEKMKDCQVRQEEDQRRCKEKLQIAQENMSRIERKLSEVPKNTPEHSEVFEEYLSAQETLDNERKAFEDLEFHHLEEEADWLASREELQREIMDLSQRIEDLQTQISELDHQQSVTLKNNADEYRKIEQQRIEYSKKIEEIRVKLKLLDNELLNYSNQESDQEISSDSDSEKHNVSSFNMTPDLSVSVFENSSPKLLGEDILNMSQSFNEKMLQEKSILDDGMEKRFPSQDDIDRISKVTSSAPMNIDDGRGSLGKKTIESLKEIERNRQLHLVQQGSQVIENERRRVLALKQRVQHEVRTKWAQRSQDCSSLNSTGSEDTQNSATGSDEAEQKENLSNGGNAQNQLEPLRAESEGPDSPRPLSDTSDVSVEVGNALGKRRPRPLGDKHRPLTRYLPIRSSELDLRAHIESAGHQVVLCPHVLITPTSCRGFLHKRGSKLNGWSRRWFVFDRNKKTLVYYADKSEKKVRGGAYFQAIEEVYLDHSNSVKSPNPQLTFIVKTHERSYYLMAPSPEAMRIWIDVIFTGAEGYQEFEPGT